MPLVEIEHPIRRLGAPVTDRIEEDLTGNPGLSRPFPQTGDDSVQTGRGIQADPGIDLRRNVDFGVPHASGCQSARNLAGRVAIVFGGPEEPADFGEEGEKRIGVADLLHAGIEHPSIGKPVRRTPPQPLHRLPGETALKMKVTIRQKRRVLSHPFSALSSERQERKTEN
jgi:hypothetical protein